ncbi:MAG: hypothetical protein IJB27_06115 [Clostridia bacterium]|nr:hypothetical protein [Clostridia bacterium]
MTNCKKLFTLLLTLTMLVSTFAIGLVPTASAASLVTPGELTGDETLNTFDSLNLFAYCSGQRDLTATEQLAADYNKDGTVNTIDATLLYACVNGERLPHPPVAAPSDYEMRVFELINEERAAEGLEPLEYFTELQHFADVRADEIQTYWSHTRPNGQICFSLFDEYDTYNHYAGGENIAAYHRTPEEVVSGWMASDGHRENILNPNFQGVVVGCQEIPENPGRYTWSQMFCYW